MMNLKHVKQQLHKAYFELLTIASSQCLEKSLSFMTERIAQLEGIRSTGIYRYCEDGYHLLHRVEMDNSEPSLNSRVVPEHMEMHQWIEAKNVNGYFMKLNAEYVLYIESKKQMDHLLLNMLQFEVVRMLRAATWRMNQQGQFKFLYHLSIRLFTMENKAEIVQEVITAITQFYPSYTTQLLLSRDTDIEIDCPIQPITYNDEEPMSYSSMAFISGEVQIEKHSEQIYKLFAPLTGNQGVYGVIQLVKEEGVYLQKNDVQFIMEIAQTAGKSIENASLMENSSHQISDLKLINDVTHKLNSNLDLKGIMEYVRNKIIDICQAMEVGFIFKRDHEYTTIEAASTSYFKSQGGAFASYLLENIDGPKFYGNYKEYPGLPYRSLLIIPMQQEFEVYGLVVIMHPLSYFFSFERFKLLQSLIQHCSLALSNAILKEELQKAVITDYLTKLYSRSYLEEMIIKLRKSTAKGALILFDIDDFKRVNDTYGHHVGDKVLKQVADVIHEYTAEEAIPSRWGGEELAIYTPNQEIDDAVALAKKICQHVERSTDPSVTVSCGVSSWGDVGKDTVSELFIRADRALYEAKSKGKNSVVKS